MRGQIQDLHLCGYCRLLSLPVSAARRYPDGKESLEVISRDFPCTNCNIIVPQLAPKIFRFFSGLFLCFRYTVQRNGEVSERGRATRIHLRLFEMQFLHQPFCAAFLAVDEEAIKYQPFFVVQYG